MTTFHPTRAHQRGVSLIEALITAVILAVGLLSVAAMQAKALQVSHTSYQRSVAVVQAQDAVERLWAGICVLNDSDALDQIETDWKNAHKGTDGMVWIAEGDTGVATDTGSRIVPNGNGSGFDIFVVWRDARLDTDSTTFEYSTILPNPKLIGCE